jgi:hypothetical protein
VCPKCGSGSFEIKEAKIRGAGFPYNFVQCASYGAVLGVAEAHYDAEEVRKLGQKLDERR